VLREVTSQPLPTPMNTDDKKEEDKDVSIKPLIWLAFSAIILCILFGTVVSLSIKEPQDRGLFGDMFGAVNALFSGLAFAGVLYTIMLQRRELEMQREELRLSRRELSAQNQMVAAQLATMQQSFAFELTKAKKAAEPFFRLTHGSSRPNMRTIGAYNLGGRISDVSCRVIEPAEGISVSLEPPDVWNTNGESEIKIVGFGASSCPECVFEMQYTDVLGNRSMKRFRAPAGLHRLEECE
jgi:hypothetical protein